MVSEKWKSILPYIAISAAILVTTFLLARIDWITNHTLYDYGLIFNLEWASDYWFALRSIIVMLNISLAITIAAGFFSYRRAEKDIAKTIYICKTCGEALTKVKGSVNFEENIPKFKVLKNCPMCNNKLQEADPVPAHISIQ